ncbi:VRR-NUC domain-containing protein [Microbulbifer variabilis]|uniref:VRR-NUC domain-containing protein n=1 Tax=Microbulbifer variabilis TaxID=266805 RepID=UPI001CFD69FF|nr:VRR-NUC domain-containing protein [Microbulbifer variabilis]
MAISIELAPDYYLTNFRTLVDFVVSRYTQLLSTSELSFYRLFCELDADSQRLYVRLLSRKGVPSSAGALFREGKLSYQEISKLTEAVDSLCSAGLLIRNPSLQDRELLALFTKTELYVAGPIGLSKSLKRMELEEALIASSTEWREELMAEEGLLAFQGAEYFQTFKLCFFGNLNQDLTDYVLRDLGLYRYESYTLDRHQLPFQSREQIEQYLLYYDCLEQAEEVLASGASEILELASQLPIGLPGDLTLARRVDRLRLKLARQLERLDQLEAAESLYRDCGQPPARERRARIAVKRDNPELALCLCREILDSPLNEAERYFAESFGCRTAKRMGSTQNWANPQPCQPQLEVFTLPQSPERVEIQTALELASREEGICHYVENSLFNGVLGLYIWDILFAPIPGAFYNPFQIAPSDFRTPHFYTSRHTLFEQRLTELSPSALKRRVMETYREKLGIANPLVAWEALSLELLELALDRIPVEHWRSLFQRLLGDITHHRNGLPDLILFPDKGGYELVEVKGPGDRLQQNQQRWLTFFAVHNIPHRVIHVEWL